MEKTEFLVNRKDIGLTQVKRSELSADLNDGEVLLKVDRFSFTANNITYASMGDALQYWAFFPAEAEMGSVPVWGFADVVATNCDAVALGERFYGYYPMSSHLVVTPSANSASGFFDGVAHRRELPTIYNQYLRSSQDPIYTASSEALQMLLRPLFTTSFLLDDFFADQDFFGANQLVLSSASSKTAIGMAFLLKHNRAARQGRYQVIGLTSQANLEFVTALGCYDQVFSYEQVAALEANTATAYVDFAGNQSLLEKIHSHFNTQLQYSCLVGLSHWDQRTGAGQALLGPKPEMFFAPAQGQKRLAEWGGAEFQQRLAAVWSLFTEFTAGWIEVQTDTGSVAVEQTYQDFLKGQVSPKAGYILSL